jgi:predicted nuclease with TOPRIM domain
MSDPEIELKAAKTTTEEVMDKLRSVAKDAEFGGPLVTTTELALLLRLAICKLDELQEEIWELNRENSSLQDQVDRLESEIDDCVCEDD